MTTQHHLILGCFAAFQSRSLLISKSCILGSKGNDSGHNIISGALNMMHLPPILFFFHLFLALLFLPGI